MPDQKQTAERKLTIILGTSRGTDPIGRLPRVESYVRLGEYRDEENNFGFDMQFTDMSSIVIDLNDLPEEYRHVKDFFDQLLDEFQRNFHSESAFQFLLASVIKEAISLAAQNQNILDTVHRVNTGKWPDKPKPGSSHLLSRKK